MGSNKGIFALLLGWALSFTFLLVPDDYPQIVLLLLLLTYFFPFLIVFVWVAENQKIKKLIEVGWVQIVIGWLAVLVWLIAGCYASETLNGFFCVGADNFPVAKTILTACYVIIGVLFFCLLLMFVVRFDVLSLALDFSKEQRVWFPVREASLFALKGIGSAVIYSTFVVLFFFWVWGLKSSLPQMGALVAYTADFNSFHRCENVWPVPVDRVVFLGDAKVLAHVAGKTGEYLVLPCNQ